MNPVKIFFSFFQKKKVKNLININNEKKYIYIHIPKNAGTSLGKIFFDDSKSHITALQVRNELTVKKYQEYYVFTFSRNPWDRFLSLYNYARLDESFYHSAINPDNALYGKHLDYDILKKASLRDCAEYLLDGRLKHDGRWNHWNPQVFWIKDEKNESLLNFCGKVENYSNDIQFLSNKFKIGKTNPKAFNKSRNKTSYQLHFDNITKNIVGDYYKDDVNYFNYSF